MSRLSTGRWSLPEINMAFVDNGVCPFDVDLAEKHLEHLCDLLTFLTGKQFNYAGIVPEDTAEVGTIYHKYVPTARGFQGDYWAWAHPRQAFPLTERIGGLCQYRADKMPLPEHFAGLCLHETLHILGVKHFNEYPSIMNNAPYHGHLWQACPMAADFYTFMLLFSRAPLWPTVTDKGDLRLNECLIHVPTIMWQPGSYAALWLEGKQENGKWILEAPNYAIQHQGYVGKPVASLQNDVLHIPLRYQGSTVEVIAPMVHFTSPSQKVRFEVSEIRPLHIHSARDFPFHQLEISPNY